MTATTKDILLLAAGVVICWVAMLYATREVAPCGYDGQPDAHWQSEFNKLDHEWRMYSHCLESGSVEKCKKEWGK